MRKPAGLKKIETAKANGQWDNEMTSKKNSAMPAELTDALAKNPNAKQYFDSLAPSYQNHYVMLIAIAKREQTRQKHVKEAIVLLNKKQKLPMK